jgi:hypothetical protein
MKHNVPKQNQNTHNDQMRIKKCVKQDDKIGHI